MTTQGSADAVQQHLLAGQAAMALYHADDALARFRIALGMDPQNHVALASVACALQFMGRRLDCLAAVQDLLKLDPNNIDARLIGAAAYADTRRIRPCMALLDEAAALDPSDVRPHVDRVQYLLAARRYSEARSALREIEVRDPSVVDLWFFLSGLAAAAGHREEALQHAVRAARALPDNERTQLCLGQALLDLRRPREAMESLERALQLSPDWWEPWVYIGKARSLLGDAAGALAAYETAYRLNPRMPLAYGALIKAYARRLRFRDMWRVWRQCMRFVEE